MDERAERKEIESAGGRNVKAVFHNAIISKGASVSPRRSKNWKRCN
jgi:hypothetical protein